MDQGKFNFFPTAPPSVPAWSNALPELTLLLPRRASIGHRQVHVWTLPQDVSRSLPDAAGSSLSADERERAARILNPEARREFISGRAILRTILSRYTSLRPFEHKIVPDRNGKPRLMRGGELPTLNFNLSHSADVYAIAITTMDAVGVDVERVRPDIELETLARRILTDRERAEFGRLDDSQKVVWFYRAWTRKEAFVKAVGAGMSIPFREVDVSSAWLNNSDSPFLGKSVSGLKSWWSQSFVPAAGYSGAVATSGKPAEISYQWVTGVGS